jgi:hypothetical protein
MSTPLSKYRQLDKIQVKVAGGVQRKGLACENVLIYRPENVWLGSVEGYGMN